MKINAAAPPKKNNDQLILEILQLIQSDKHQQAESKVNASSTSELPLAMRHYLLALCAEGQGQIEQAIALQNKAIELDDKHPFAYSGLANALLIQDRNNHLEDACTLVQAEFNLHQRPASLERLLTLTAERQAWQDLEQHAKKMLAIQADNTTALMSLGLAILEQTMITTPLNVDLLTKSIQAFLLALKVNPNLAEAHKALAKAFSTAGELKTAEQHYLNAVQLNPSDTESLMAAGLSKICHKELAEGWKMVSKRSEFGSVRYGMDTSNFNNCPAPLWLGQDLKNKNILVTTEQGIGDQILFGQLITELDQQGAQITLSCNDKILSILQRSLPNIKVVSDKAVIATKTLSQQHFKASLLELTQYLRPDIASLKNRNCYLTVDDNLKHRTADKYQRLFGDKIKVGIAWQSHTQNLGALKSVELEQWLDILKTPGIQLISTQYRPNKAELDSIKNRFGIDIYQDDFDPFDDCEQALAQLANLDLLISVSNSGVHMAGQLGIPTWVLVNKTPLWHWFSDGETSPWYESIKLYRQELPGNWEKPLQSIQHDLSTWLAS